MGGKFCSFVFVSQHTCKATRAGERLANVNVACQGLGREAESVATLVPVEASTGLDYSVHTVGEGSIKADNLLRDDVMQSSRQRCTQVFAISADASDSFRLATLLD